VSVIAFKRKKSSPEGNKKTVKKVVKKNSPSKELVDLVTLLNKKHGNNALVFGPELLDRTEVKTRISTGIFALDIALGGGIPIGRVSEVSGALSSTKTTSAVHMLVQAQKMGLKCSFLDVEGTSDKDYLEHLGVDTSVLLYSRPCGLEETTQMILDFQKSGVINFALWDSIEATPPMIEFFSEMDQTVQMGSRPKLLGEFFRKFQANNNLLSREGKMPFTLVATNQLREKIGSFGDIEYCPGGRATGFYASIQVRYRRGDWIAIGTKDKKVQVGQINKFKIFKNKVDTPYKTGEFDFYFSERNEAGVKKLFFDNEKSVVQEAVFWGIVVKSGSWYTYKDFKCQGVEEMVCYFRDKPDEVESIKQQVLEITRKVKLE